MPAPAFDAHVWADMTRRTRHGSALIAATTCAAVLVSLPSASVARLTFTSFWPPMFGVTDTMSGESATPGFTNCARVALPPF